jgi:hypothetical protein
LQHYAEAEEFLLKALDLAVFREELPGILDCYTALTTLYETQGVSAKALD